MQEPQQTWVRFLDQEDPLEEGAATQPSILAWMIPQTEELARYVHRVTESAMTKVATQQCSFDSHITQAMSLTNPFAIA